jgi:hypothetical protein
MAEPSVWGPSTWRAIHYIALGYPAKATGEDARVYRDFVHALGRVIPCTTCAANFQRHLVELPLTERDLRGRLELFEWTVRLHNLVNTETGKRPWTVDEALAVYAAGHGGGSRPGSGHVPPSALLGFVVGLSSLAVLGAVTFAALRRRRS